MKKTSYHVIDNDQTNANGYKRCIWCKKLFKPPDYFNGNRTKYCSDECYREAQKVNQQIWWIKNREKYKEQQREYQKKRYWKKKKNTPPKPEKLKPLNSVKLMVLSVLRCRIIKQHLINMELMSFQFDSRDREKQKIDYSGYHLTRKDTSVVDFIKDKLDQLGLYSEHHINLDFEDDYIFDEHLID